MKIRLKKLTELEDALHPNNIEEGYEHVSYIADEYFRPPTVDERFNTGQYFSTSGVQEILSENTFRTYSSIYEWEIVDEDTPTTVKYE